VIADLIQPACTDTFQWWKFPLQVQTLDRCKVHNQDVPICVMLICWGSPISSWRSTCSIEIDFQDPSCACKCNSATYKRTVLYTWSVAAILPRLIFHATCSMTIMTRCMHTVVEVAIIDRASCNYHWVATHLQLWLVQYVVPEGMKSCYVPLERFPKVVAYVVLKASCRTLAVILSIMFAVL
jgi:hypothetical protein